MLILTTTFRSSSVHDPDRVHVPYMALVREHWETINYIKMELDTAVSPWCLDHVVDAEYCLLKALEAWQELDNEIMSVLWKAPSKGGVFTTLERKQLKDAASIAARRRIAENREL